MLQTTFLSRTFHPATPEAFVAPAPQRQPIRAELRNGKAVLLHGNEVVVPDAERTAVIQNGTQKTGTILMGDELVFIKTGGGPGKRHSPTATRFVTVGRFSSGLEANRNTTIFSGAFGQPLSSVSESFRLGMLASPLVAKGAAEMWTAALNPRNCGFRWVLCSAPVSGPSCVVEIPLKEISAGEFSLSETVMAATSVSPVFILTLTAADDGKNSILTIQRAGGDMLKVSPLHQEAHEQIEFTIPRDSVENALSWRVKGAGQLLNATDAKEHTIGMQDVWPAQPDGRKRPRPVE